MVKLGDEWVTVTAVLFYECTVVAGRKTFRVLLDHLEAKYSSYVKFMLVCKEGGMEVCSISLCCLFGGGGPAREVDRAELDWRTGLSVARTVSVRQCLASAWVFSNVGMLFVVILCRICVIVVFSCFTNLSRV